MRFTKYFQVGCILCSLYAAPLATAFAQGPVQVKPPLFSAAPIKQSSYDQKMLHNYFAGIARQYKFKTDTGEELLLRDQPLMHSHNPERESDEAGTIFLWETKDGRPAVIQVIFSYWRENTMKCRHELISLLPEALQAEFESEIVWRPQGDSIKFTKLSDVQAPAANASRRLIQMRQIAKDFSGELGILNQPIVRLTLLPTPLHRYEAADEKVVDVAIFSFAVSTDAEIQLILEARKESDGSMSWYWSAARSNYQELDLSYKGNKVWNAKREMALEKSGPGEMPYARQDYYILTPRKAMPLPDQLK